MSLPLPVEATGNDQFDRLTGTVPEASRLDLGWRDFAEGLRRWELWGTLGWHDVRQRYRRSILGPFWITLSMAIMVAGLSLLWSTIFRLSIPDYLPFFTVGFVVWTYLSSVITEGCTVFYSAEGIIKQIPVPLSIHVYRTVWRNLIIAAHNLLIYFAVIIALRVNPGFAVLYAIPAFVLLAAFSVGSVLLVGVLSARYRDIPPIVASTLQMIFFFSPILWMPEALPDRKYLVTYNPFTYLLDVMRKPLLGAVPDLSTWAVVCAITAIVCATAFVLFARYRTRIAYWI